METDEQANENQVNLEERANYIKSKINSSYSYWALKKLVKDEIPKQKHKSSEASECFLKIIKELEVDIKLKNKINDIYSSMFSADPSHHFAISVANGLDASKPIPMLPPCFSDPYFEPLQSLRQARIEWSEEIRSRLLAVCTGSLVSVRANPWAWAIPEEGVPRPDGDDENEKLVDMKKEDIPFIYSADMLLNALCEVNNMNYRTQLIEWGSVQLRLRTSPLDLIRATYEELDVCFKQVGLDEDKAFLDERTYLGERLINKDYIPYLVQFCKRGVPNGLRAAVYSRILDISIGAKEISYFEHLIGQVQKWEYGFDKMVMEDVRDSCNDDKFFVFHELLEKMVMCFLRDPWVFENLKSLPNLPLSGITNDGRFAGNVPICGIIPFKHFSLYGAAFTYISERTEECYFLYRNFYCKYLCYLHSFTSDERGIISLLRLFEDVLQAYDPDLVYFLTQMKINPLKIAFPWILYCFISYLEPDQIFVLFDRIIGYDSAEIVALVAVALFIYRSELIMQAANEEEVDDLFYDISHIKVIPLLQHFLFIEKHIC